MKKLNMGQTTSAPQDQMGQIIWGFNFWGGPKQNGVVRESKDPLSLLSNYMALKQIYIMHFFFRFI